MRKYKLSKKMLLRRIVSDERGAIPLEYLIIATAGLAIAAFVAFQMKRWLCLRSLPQSEQFAVDPAFGCADDLERAIRQCFARGQGLGRDFTCYSIPMPSKCDDGKLWETVMPGKIGVSQKDTLGFNIKDQVTGATGIADDYNQLKELTDCHNTDTGAIGAPCSTLYISYDYATEMPNIIIGDGTAQRAPSC